MAEVCPIDAIDASTYACEHVAGPCAIDVIFFSFPSSLAIVEGKLDFTPNPKVFTVRLAHEAVDQFGSESRVATLIVSTIPDRIVTQLFRNKRPMSLSKS